MQENQFTEGKILPSMLKFALPVLAALFLQATYGAVALMIVGQFGDASGVSAVGTGSSIIQLVTLVIAGFTMGTTVVIGQHIGEKRPDKAGIAIGSAIYLFLAVILLFTAIMLIFAKTFTSLMNAPDDAFDKTVGYVKICSMGIIFITSYNVISGIFRGIGNSKLPMLFVAIACVINIVGDLILVGLLGMDANGAAIATVTAQACSVIISLIILRKFNKDGKLPFEMKKEYLKPNFAYIKRIIKLGTPIAFQDAVVNISFLLICSIVNSIGLNESAGYGISQKVVAYIMLVPSAIMQSGAVIVAQNFGAGNMKRAKESMYTSMKAGCVAGVFLFCCGFFFGDIISGIFSSDADVIAQSFAYLKGFSYECLLTNILFSYCGYFNGIGKTQFVMLQGLLTSVIIRLPLALFLSSLEGATLTTIAYTAPLTTCVGIVFFTVIYKKLCKQEAKQELQS